MDPEEGQVNTQKGNEVNNGILNEGYDSIECKLEVVSGEEDEDPIGNPQEKEISVKEEDSDPKETTADESMAVEALRQLGGMFDNSSTPIPTQPSAPPETPSTVTPEVPYRQHICSICGESFERKNDLGNHIVCHQVDRPHACRTCGNLFRRKADLQNHMMCHQLERPHRCNQCGVDFQRPSSLTNHMKIHTYYPGRALLPSNALMSNLQNITNVANIITNTTPTIANTSNTSLPDESHIPPSNGWDINYSENLDESSNYQQNSNENDVINEFNCDENLGQVVNTVQTAENVETVIPLEQNQQLSDFTLHDNGMETNNSIQNNTSINYDSENFIELGVKQEDVPLTTPLTEQSKSSEDTNRRPHVCRHCGLTFSREKALKCHVLLHQDHWGSPIECQRCEEMFPEEISFQQHQKVCRGGKKRRQNSQQSSKVVQRDYEQPRKTPKQLGKHICTECEKRFTTKQKLYRHMWIHRKTPFVCELCGIHVGDKETLDEHKRDIHPGESAYACNECGKNFASRQGLWEHGKIHANSMVTHASPLLCQRCGKTFASRQGHLIHMRTHTGERPYGCRFCWKAFRDGGTLRKHERIHTGERPHVCPLCPRAFNQKVVLREHVRWVHAARNTDGCQICGYVVADREALCAHIVKHSDELAAVARAAKKKQGTETAAQQEVSSVDPDASTSISVEENNEVNINHIEDIPEIKIEYTCDMCGEAFKERPELVNHVRIHI